MGEVKKWTRFKKWIVVLVSIALLTCIGIIITLLTALKVSEGRLNELGNTMEAMAGEHIITLVEVDTSIALNSKINIVDEIVVNIDMLVESEIPFTAEIPVSENMMIPFKIGVQDYIKLDTTIQVTDYVHILVDDTIPMDQKVKLPIFGKKGPSMPIQGKIPIKQSLYVGFDEALPVNAVVPIDMMIIDTMPVGLDMRIPVDVMVPVRIPLKSTAKITFNDGMPVEAMIPINLAIPVDIPLSETPLAAYFIKMAGQMRGLTKLSLDD